MTRGVRKLAADDPRHGTVNGYGNLGCRCSACRDAWAVEFLKLREKRAAILAANPDIVAHGKATTYQNWKCRCEPCTAAATGSKRAQSQRHAGAGRRRAFFDLQVDALRTLGEHGLADEAEALFERIDKVWAS